MLRLKLYRVLYSKLMALLIGGVLLSVGATIGYPSSKKLSRTSAKPTGAAEKYLFVWAGDQARTAPDFLAVVDFVFGVHFFLVRQLDG